MICVNFIKHYSNIFVKKGEENQTTFTAELTWIEGADDIFL